MTHRTRWIIGLTALFLFSFLLRVVFLRTTPAIFSHDELHYIDEAQTIVLNGSDLTGTWRPWELRPTSPLYAELPSLMIAPGSLLFSDPFWEARAVSIVLGLLLPVVIGGIAYSLTKKKVIFLATLILGLFNPWIFQFSRLSFDPLFSLFWYALGVWMLIGLNSRWKLASFIPFFFGFFQYQGLKIIFLPLLFLVVSYVIWRDWPTSTTLKVKNIIKEFRGRLWQPVAVLLLSFLLFASFVIRLPGQSAGSRINDILFFNETFLSQQVNDQRRISLESPAAQLATNKFTVIIQAFLTKYFQTFDLSQLFIRGESVRNPFSVWTRGIFHPVDVVLLIAGFYALASQKKWRKEALLLLGFVAISPLPVAVNTVDTWVMFRGSWLVVSFLIVMGVGAWQLWTALPKILVMAFLSAYVLVVLSFGNEYFIHYPIYSTKGTAFAERVVANYIARLPKETKVVVLVDESRFVFESYLAYNNLITKENVPEIQKAMTENVYKLGNVLFTTDCMDSKLLEEGTVVINNSANVTCDKQPLQVPNIPYAKIPALMDNGVLFTVYNDVLCSQYALRQYVHVTDRKVLDVERLDTHQFCDQLFSKPVE